MNVDRICIFLIAVGLIILNLSNDQRILKLELQAEKYKSGCARGMVVMTIEGYATNVCAP